MTQRVKITNSTVKFLVFFILIALLLEGISVQGGNGQVANSNLTIYTDYNITFSETGLPTGTSWTVKVISNYSANTSYSSNSSLLEFSVTNGSYTFVALSTTSYVTPEASGSFSVSGSPVSISISFQRTAVSEYYQPFILMNMSQEKVLDLSSQTGPSALSFGVMNTTVKVQVYNNSGMIYEKNITGDPTDFNATMASNGYGYVNFLSSGSVSVYATDVGTHSGYFALDLWNYYISNYSASLITLPPHFQEVFGTGSLNPKIPTFVAVNNTGMSFTLVAPYYKEAVPFSIWIGEGFNNPLTGKYWWAQVGFNNWLTGMYDVSYAGWGVFSNYVNTTGGTDSNYPLVPNETYTFTMQAENNGTWGFFANGQPINESGHSAYFRAPTDYASGEAYLGIEPLVGQRAGPLNSTSFFQGSIVIPNAESFLVNGTWERASNLSFLYGVRDWQDGHGGTTAGMNIWGIEGNIQNKSIPKGEIVLNNGPYTPYDVPSGVNYDVYPISGNVSFPWENESRFGNFVTVSEESNGTILLTPLQKNTEISIVRFQNDSGYVYSDHDMIISHPVYAENPALDFKAAIFAVPINASTSYSGYNGIFQEIALSPIFSTSSKQINLFSLGNVSTSYSGQVFIPVYINNAQSLVNLKQIFSFDSSLLQFVGTLGVISSQNITFSYENLSSGVLELRAEGSFDIISNHSLLFYLVFQPLIEEQTSTEILLDSALVNGFAVNGNSSSNVTLAEGWTSIGPSDIKVPGSNMSYGGLISDVAFSPIDMNVLYAASGQSYPMSGPNGYPGDSGFGGVLKSTDGGKTWTVENLGLTTASITSMAVNPQNPDIVVVETRGMEGGNPVGGAIFKTVNGGLSWEQTYDSGGFQLQYLNGTLYATTFYSLLESNNFGTTWTKIADFSNIVTSSLILDSGGKIYVGLWSLSGNVTDEIMESTDHGSSFGLLVKFYESEFSGMEPSISQIVASPSNDSNMWAIIDSPYPARELGSPSLYRSPDGGKTWQQVNTTAVGMGYQSEPPSYMTFDPSNGSIIYVVGNGFIFVSTNGGDTFTGVLPPNSATFPDKLVVDPSSDNTIFLCSEGGLFVSHDRGKNWAPLSNFSTNLLLYVAVDNSKIFGISEGQSPLYSSNSGSNWTIINKGYLGVVSVDPYNSSIVIMWTETHTTAGGPFFFVSVDGGKSFFLPSINFTAEVNPSVENIAFSKGVIFVPGGTGIFYSKDNGATWSVFENSPTNASTVVDSPSDQNILYSSNISGLYESTDGGVLWNKINSNIFEALSVDPSNSSILAATTTYGSPYVYRSMISYDGGKSFGYLGMSSHEFFLSFSDIYFQEVAGKLGLVFTSDQGLYLSYNLGSTWTNVSYNLPSTLINSFFSTGNGTSYVATWGSGIYTDPQLFNLSFHRDVPILCGYLPAGYNVTIDGASIYEPGYFSLDLSPGNNSVNWEGKELYLTGYNGDIYFLNFSNMQIHLSISDRNLPEGVQWNVSANGKTFAIHGNDTITLPPGTEGIYVYPVATDFSIYYPSRDFYPINSSSLISSITVLFSESVQTAYANFTSSMNGMFWSTQVAYNLGYLLFAGGTLGLVNASSSRATILQIPDYAGIADTVVPFKSGFLIGGSASQNIPGIYYYDIATGVFTNYSSLLPSSWNETSSKITNIFEINSSSFGFLGVGVGSVYFGTMENGRFVSLDQYLPPSFTPTGGYYGTYSAAYISSRRAVILTDGSDIGIFYLNNLTFHDTSLLMPEGFYIGSEGGGLGYSYVATNSTTAIITGFAGNRQFILFYNPVGGVRDLSSLFPSSQYVDTVCWYGNDVVLSGYSENNSSPSIFIYNTSSDIPTVIGTKYYGNVSMVDSAIEVGNSIYFSTFKMIPVPGQSYVIYTSYYGDVRLTPTGRVSLNLNVPSDIGINGKTYYAKNATITEFTGNYTISISSRGYTNFSRSVYISPFETLTLNVTLAKVYNVTFAESGLPPGTSWNVTLDGTVESSTSPSITFSVTDGSYSYSIGAIAGYTSLSTSGTLYVNGSNVSKSVSFSPTTYIITFAESGLQNGTVWSVTLNGTVKSSSSGNITFNVPNGTYPYSIAPVPGYSVISALGYNETSGSITVSGYNIKYPLSFLRSKGYFLAEVNPVNATLYINGTAYQRTGVLFGLPAGNSGGIEVEYFNVSLGPGTYQVKISAPGYLTYKTTITMSSQLTPIHGNYTLEKLSSHSSLPFVYISIIAVIVVIAAVTTAILLRRRGGKGSEKLS